MKKEYNAPVAEMMEFDYEENVVASQTINDKKHGVTQVGETGNKSGCTKIRC